MGEAAYQVDKDYKEADDHLGWYKIEGLRHILVHNYYSIQPGVIWNTRNIYLSN